MIILFWWVMLTREWTSLCLVCSTDSSLQSKSSSVLKQCALQQTLHSKVISLSVCLSLCVALSVCLSLSVSVCLCLSLFVSLTVPLSVSVSLCLSLSHSLSLSLSLSLSHFIPLLVSSYIFNYICYLDSCGFLIIS